MFEEVRRLIKVWDNSCGIPEEEIIKVWDNSCGIPEEEIIKAEKMLNVKIPKFLRAYYLELGNNEINFRQDELLLPNARNSASLKRLRFESQYLTFYQENQGCHYWGIKKTDLEKENPPVYRKEKESWITDSDNLSDFLIGIAFWQSGFGFDYNASRIDILNSEVAEALRLFNKESFLFDKWNVEFYRNAENELISVHRIYKNYAGNDYSHLFVTCQNKERFAEILDSFNIEWTNVETP